MFDYQMGVTKEQGAVQKAGREAIQPRATALADDTGYSDQLKQQLTGLTRDQGFSPEEQAAMTQETTGGVSSAFGKAREGAARRVAATGNSAGYAGFSGDLAREEAKALSSSTRQNKLAFANERRNRMMQNYGLAQSAEDEQQRRQEQGTNLLARLYGIDTGSFNSGRNAAMPALQNYTGLANQKGFGSKLQDMGLDVASAWLSPAIPRS